MFVEKKINKYPSFSCLNILIVGRPQQEREQILLNETFWGQKVKIHYCASPQSLARMLVGDTLYELVIFDYVENILRWELYRKILDRCDSVILFTVPSKVPDSLEHQLARDNVYCIPLGAKNTRHLKCSLRTIRNHIFRYRKHILDLFDKSFDEYIIGLTIDNNLCDLDQGVSRLLSGLSSMFDFEMVLALMREGESPIQVLKNDFYGDFCSLLTSNNGISKICEDFLEGRANYIPSEFLYSDFLRFNATQEKARTLVHYLKDTIFCGLCHLFGYRSLVFVPFRSASGRKWLFIFADKKVDKATEELCRYFEEKLPFLIRMLSYLEQYSQEKSLLNLHRVSLKTGHIGVWEYEVDSRKIISSGLQALFPFLKVPDELTEWWKYIHPSDRDDFWHAVKPCIQGATNSFAIDHRLLLPGDRLVWVRTIGECISRKGKYAKKLVGVGMDITSFMESEHELKDVKENLEIASEMGNIGLWSWDILKDEYNMNPPGLEMFRIKKKGPYILEDWLNCVVPTHRELVRKELGETLAKEEGVFNMQYPIYYRGMYKSWIHTYGRVSGRDSKGNPIRISGTHVDITERKMLEKQLQSEAIINSLYASFARSLLSSQTEEEVTSRVCQMGVDILNSAFCFSGYFDPDEKLYFFQGVDKKKSNRLMISLSSKDFAKEELLYRFIEAGSPLLINDIEEKEYLLFGRILIQRLLFYPSYTPSHDLVLIIAVNSSESYTPSNWESIEWMASVYAQAMERIRLEKRNIQKARELEETIEQLQEALNTVRHLHGLLPICARCKKIRDDSGYWQEVEVYIRQHSEAEFSHGICPQCAKELYGDFL